jgi:hypothetical protein
MQLPSVDRLNLNRPAGAAGVLAGANRVIPVAPVNPSVSVAESSVALRQATTAAPSVVNLVNTANKPNTGEGVYASVSDPAKRGSEAATSEKDWTIRRPEPEKVVVPPPVPISKLLMDFLRDMWRASGSAVEAGIAEQVARSQNTPTPSQTAGQATRLDLTYAPTKVLKTEKSLSGDSPSNSTSP